MILCKLVTLLLTHLFILPLSLTQPNVYRFNNEGPLLAIATEENRIKSLNQLNFIKLILIKIKSVAI